jgi:hypothetical protein
MERAMFELLSTPIAQSLNDVDGQPLTTLLLGGIVNPFGPTLNVVAAIGKFEPNRNLPLVRLMLNPFSQEVTQIGDATVAERWSPLQNFEPLLELAFGACPTLVLPSHLLDDEDALAITARWLAGFDDARETMDRVGAHLGDPWTRVSTEIHQGATDYVAAKLKPEQDSRLPVPLPLTEEEALTFARTVLSYKHFEPEVQAFLYAWKGSIDFQRENGSGRLALSAMSLESVQAWLTACSESCRVPEES